MNVAILKPGRLLAGIALAGILAGGLAWLMGAGGAAEALWALTTAVVLVPLALTVAATLGSQQFLSVLSAHLRHQFDRATADNAIDAILRGWRA